jgi:HEAT repeat protein
MEHQSMSEKEQHGVPFSSDHAEEQRLWNELANVAQPTPSMDLRRRFYAELDRRLESAPPRWRSGWLSLIGLRGLSAAVVCLAVGILVGRLWPESTLVGDTQLAELQQQVAILNRNLILDRLENVSANKRLLGVMEAGTVAENDSEVARALLTRAVEDRVHSVRSAAIDALGPQVNTPAVGDELMALLEKTESPLVQLALVDLVLRHGNAQQLDRLLQLSDRGVLHPDLVEHVKAAVERNRV